MTVETDTDLIRTRNDLPPGVRLQACELLNRRLADCIDLTGDWPTASTCRRSASRHTGTSRA
ncbi:MAG: hypothetical protein ACXU7G_13135 [Croceibacterium sp.]